MTDDQTTVVAAIGDDTGVQAAGAAVTDYEYTAIVAVFNDVGSAEAAYQDLEQAEKNAGLGIEGVLVIKTDDKGKVKIQKMTDHSTKTGVEWGVVGGVVLGLLFPPALIATTIGVGVVGGVLGKTREEWHKHKAGEALTDDLGPNQSGILALVDSGDVVAVTAKMPAATSVKSAGVDDKTAQSIKDAAAKAS